MMNNIILTIGITSYNRVKELKRALNSIKCSTPEKIEIVVSEDHSPQREEIKSVVTTFAKSTNINVFFNSNEVNLGYDRNLKKIISMSNGDYVFFLSDDDCLYSEAIDIVLQYLNEKVKDAAVLYGPFYQEGINEYRRYYQKSEYIQKGETSAGRRIADSILFSGLIYRIDSVKEIDAEPFLNKNYFQVYMFLHCIYHFGGYYINKPMVKCVSDGENAYGFSDSAVKNPLLMNRDSPLSNLEFNRGLLEVIKMFDQKNETHTFTAYSKEYNLRSYVGMSNARAYGRKCLNDYFIKFKNIGIKVNVLPYIYFILLYFLGAKVCNMLMDLPKTLLFRYRKEIR